MSARERWNARYAAAETPGAPAQWLVEHRALLAPLAGGRALDVACGDGRNALELARLGLEVDAIDISDIAIARLAAYAAQHDLPIAARTVDLERDGLPAGRWDAIAVFNYLQRDLLEPLRSALAPGGVLLYETFAAAHIDELGKAFNPDYVLERNELLRAFEGLHVVHYREGVAGERGVASLLAQRRR